MAVRLPRPRVDLIPLLLILLLAAGLRWHQLEAQSLWNDEGSSYVQATRSLPEIAANAARDIHPPGYYVLLALWRGLTGDSEFALRSLSVFASLLTVALTFALGRRLFSPAAGGAAALLLTLNTFSLYYAQEARMYALLALWGVAGVWLVSRLTTRQPGGWLVIGLGLVNAAGLYSQYAYPFVMLAQGVYIVVLFVSRLRQGMDWGLLRRFVLANGLALLLYLPWLPTALRQITTWPSTGQPIPPAEALGIIGGWFTFGITYSAVENASSFIPLALLLLGGGLVAWVLLRGRALLIHLLLPILLALLPVGLFLLLGLFRLANLKFLLPSQIGFALLLGAGWAGWWMLAQRGSRITLVFALLLGGWVTLYLVNGLAPLYDDPRFQRPDYRAMVALITQSPQTGDAIILDAPNQEEVFRYYYRGAAPVYPLPPGLGGNDAATQTAVRRIIAEHERIFVLFWGEAERDPNRVVETTLDSEAFEAGQDRWFGDVRFARYAAPIPLRPSQPVHARFGSDIWLERYAISGRVFAAGDVAQVQLEWRTEAAQTTRYKVFVQLLNSGGVLVAQRDAEPGGNLLPTTGWTPGETVLDRHGLALPEDLPAGGYTLIVGLYNIDDPNQRLPVYGRTYIALTRLTVR